MKHKIGLVLSGGGAKGAYEIGVWKALDIMGILPYIDGIYGTSVGALNTALLDTCGSKRAEEIWLNLKTEDFFCRSVRKDNFTAYYEDELTKEEKIYNEIVSLFFKDPSEFKNKSIKTLLSKILPFASVIAFGVPLIALSPAVVISLKASVTPLIYRIINYGLPFSQQKIHDLIKDNIVFSNFQCRKMGIFCTCAKIPHKVEQFDLYDYNDRTKRYIILASSAMPFLYTGKKGIKIDKNDGKGEKGYFDGGMKKKYNTPLVPMIEDGWEQVICVWLDSKAKTKSHKNANIVHIKPSFSFGGFFSGTVKVDSEKIKKDIDMGFWDTLKKEKEFQEMINGMSPI